MRVVPEVLRLLVPELIERPAVGTSCCASTAEAIIAQELTMLGGIEDVVVKCAAGEVHLTFDPAATSIAAICAALDEIGYPASAAPTLAG
jgi:copper chaperone CopZ